MFQSVGDTAETETETGQTGRQKRALFFFTVITQCSAMIQVLFNKRF